MSAQDVKLAIASGDPWDMDRAKGIRFVARAGPFAGQVVTVAVRLGQDGFGLVTETGQEAGFISRQDLHAQLRDHGALEGKWVNLDREVNPRVVGRQIAKMLNGIKGMLRFYEAKGFAIDVAYRSAEHVLVTWIWRLKADGWRVQQSRKGRYSVLPQRSRAKKRKAGAE